VLPDIPGIEGPLPFASGKKRLEPEYAAAYDAWRQNPSPAANSQLLRAVDPIISQATQVYGGASKNSPLLRSQARLEAVRALQSYDPNKSALRTHLMSRLQRLQRLGAQQTHVISVPEQVIFDRRELEDTEAALEEDLGREPTDDELADKMGLSTKRIAYIRQGRMPIATSQAQQTRGGIEQALPPHTVAGQGESEAWEDLIYYDLTPTDKLIYDYLSGKHGRQARTTSDIARSLGLTPSAISQRAAKIQQKLDELWDIEQK
jgi:RNA polymerase primary sigma factor